MNSNIKEQRSIAGLRANAAAFLINLAYFLPGINLIVPIVALILENENDFVRNYAKQTQLFLLPFQYHCLTYLILK